MDQQAVKPGLRLRAPASMPIAYTTIAQESTRLPFRDRVLTLHPTIAVPVLRLPDACVLELQMLRTVCSIAIVPMVLGAAPSWEVERNLRR